VYDVLSRPIRGEADIGASEVPTGFDVDTVGVGDVEGSRDDGREAALTVTA
jgi:hypothetical protein